MDSLDATKQILAAALMIPADSISADDRLLELKGMDSLAFESILVGIEDLTGRDLDAAKAVGAETVADLALLLEKLKNS